MYSDPAVGANFFGREDIIELLLKRARALKDGYRQNVALIGHQQLGKTSLLRHFLHTLNDSDLLPIYVEIKIQALDYFVDQFIRSLLYQYLRSDAEITTRTTLDELVNMAGATMPKTMDKVREITSLLNHRHPEEAYAKLFELTSSVKQETGKNCIVVLDEFHRLGEFGLKSAFSDFGKRIMLQKDTLYLLSSSSFSASRKILAEKLSLLFGNFERIYLEPFSFETANAFLKKELSGLDISDATRYFLISFTDGHPFFLNTLLKGLRDKAKLTQKTTIDETIVAQVFQELFYESQGIFNQVFLKWISPWTHSISRGSHLLILSAIAEGKNKLKDISVHIRRNQKETSAELKELMMHELVIKTGVFYRFHNKIFKFWLKEVYAVKELTVLAVGKEEAFASRVREIMTEHAELSQLGVDERIQSLLSAFDNDQVEFGEKGRKLPHFTEFLKSTTADLANPDGVNQIVAKGHGRCWICSIVEDKVTEKEILALVRTAAADKKSTPTKVLVALRGFDENAKLLAKEKKIFTLGLSRVNMLLDIYGKHPIIPNLEHIA